jgi:thiosulfate/3-mercaptopyruvate sulfurtransferase
VIAPVVDVEWVASHDVVLADVRWYLDGRSGRDAYERGHIPGAVFVDLDRVLAAPASPADGRHPLPSPEAFAESMAALRIGDDDTVVAYDDAGGVTAARLVWMLRATGHAAALLDGGLDAWRGPLASGAKAERSAAPSEAAARPPARFSARPWPAEPLATIHDAADGRNVVLDARERTRYVGAAEPVDPRPGHIPGARSLPTRGHLAPDKRFLPAGELRARFEAVGVEDGAQVVSYCGSGVNACHSLLALERAGFAPGRLYPGSYSQWSHSDREVETGE